MQEKKLDNQVPFFTKISQYGLYKKVLLLSLFISITPILIFGLDTIITLGSTKADIVGQIENVVEGRVRDAIELQAFLTANSVSRFLKQRELDLNNLVEIIPTDKHYSDFAKLHKSEIWIRTGYNETPHDAHISIPIYKEIAFIDNTGLEKVKISNNSIVPKQYLKNVSIPSNTTYGVENYFSETAKLGKNEIYVSHLTGFYITQEEQLGSASNIEEAVEAPIYNGVIRMAMPIYNDTVFTGVVMIAFDHQHLMEFTQHILPNKKEQIVFPIYNSGNYAFMFDDRGWIITHPKYWDIPGIDKNGQWVKAYNENSSDEDIKIGRIPFNLDTAGFVHPNYPLVAQSVRNKKSGSVVTTNIGGIRKVMAYAPIMYSTGDYEKYGIFGGITIGAELQQFRASTAKVAEELSGIIILFRDNISIFVVFTFLITAIASWLFSRSVTKPIVQMTSYAKNLADGNYVEPVIVNRNDEIGILSKTINFMASELQQSNQELMESLSSLKHSKSKIETYTKDLEYQITIFKSIQQIGNILGSSTSMDTVLEYILRNCIESLKFDRAVLYLLDKEGKYLEYREQCGLSTEEEQRAKRARYNIENQDCIETRVQKTGNIIFVKEFKNYDEATEFDKRIYRSSQSESFVYVPLKVKEKVIGILGADRHHTKSEIKEIDINSLQIFANQASRIIENSQLYQNISEQRNFFEDIIKFMVKGVITIDSNHIITSINKAARKILGIESREITGISTVELFRAYTVINDAVHKFINSENLDSYANKELKVEFQNKYLIVNISSHELGKSSKPGFIIIIEDITEKKLLDDHLHHIDRLASMGKFAAGIAHEIRNPLTGISVFLDDLHDKISQETDTAGFIKLALKEIERLESLVNELLDYASPGGAKLVSKDINEIIQSTLHFTEKQCRDTNIKVETIFHKNLPKVFIDTDKIRQALLNIILNAVQAVSSDGTIRISTQVLVATRTTPLVSSSVERDISHWVTIQIDDSGPGITEENQKHIFEPFFTLKQSGTGLGLSITHSIIAEHNGKIEVKQSDLQGASFTIYLPVTQDYMEAD